MPAHAGFLPRANLHFPQRDAGMEHFMEVPDSKTTDSTRPRDLPLAETGRTPINASGYGNRVVVCPTRLAPELAVGEPSIGSGAEPELA
jgi:hypothetical protein